MNVHFGDPATAGPSLAGADRRQSRRNDRSAVDAAGPALAGPARGRGWARLARRRLLAWDQQLGRRRRGAQPARLARPGARPPLAWRAGARSSRSCRRHRRCRSSVASRPSGLSHLQSDHRRRARWILDAPWRPHPRRIAPAQGRALDDRGGRSQQSRHPADRTLVAGISGVARAGSRSRRLVGVGIAARQHASPARRAANRGDAFLRRRLRYRLERGYRPACARRAGSKAGFSLCRMAAERYAVAQCPNLGREHGRATMKAQVRVRLKPGVLDPQGKAIGNALAALGFSGVAEVRQGKLFELDLAETEPIRAREQIEAMCRELLANPVIEDYAIEFVSAP